MSKKITIKDLAKNMYEVDRAATEVLDREPELRPFAKAHLENRKEKALNSLRDWLIQNEVVWHG